MKKSEDMIFISKYKNLMSKEDWQNFQKNLEDQSKWEIYYDRIEKISENIKKEIVIWEEYNILGFFYQKLDQGLDLAFFLREFTLECVVIDDGDAIDYYQSSYENNYKGDIKFIKEILIKYG